MSIKKTLASVLAGAVVASAAFVAAAAPASATDEGDNFLGTGILWFNAVGALSTQSEATYINSGANATAGGNLGTGRPWATMTTLTPCPAGSAQLTNYVRIPQNGVPEINWPQVSIGANTTTQDADGRFYTNQVLQADRLNKSEVLSYLATQPGNTASIPLISVCRDNLAISTGYFRTLITFTGTTGANLTWSIPATALPKPASTTTLAASATTVELGTSVDLTATVAPAAATGSVEFFAGTTSLGTAVLASGVATLSTAALPVGTSQVTAQYLGGSHAASTSAAVAVDVTPVAPRTTTTTLAVSPVSGPAYSAVTLTTTVTASIGAANGTVTFKDGATVLGSLPVTAGVVAPFTSNVLGVGAHSLTAEFVGSAPYSNSASAAVVANYDLVGGVDPQVVDVEIPVGTITITTPYHPEHNLLDANGDEVLDTNGNPVVVPANPLHLGTATLDPSDSTYSASAPFSSITITDSRSGNLGFTASVVSGDFQRGTPVVDSFPAVHAGLTGLEATQVAGNALQSGNVVVTNHAPFTDGLNVPKVFATYAAGQTIGTAELHGVFGVDQVPTSVTPGLYTATVTFTAV